MKTECYVLTVRSSSRDVLISIRDPQLSDNVLTRDARRRDNKLTRDASRPQPFRATPPVNRNPTYIHVCHHGVAIGCFDGPGGRDQASQRMLGAGVRCLALPSALATRVCLREAIRRLGRMAVWTLAAWRFLICAR